MATVPVVSRGIGRKPPSEIRIEAGVAIVSLSRGFETTIDIEDVPTVSGYRWCVLIHHQTGHAYAVRFERGKCFLMHRVLLGVEDGRWVDHEDANGLNNRRSNIRVATPSQNSANMVATRLNKIGVKGVHKVPSGRFVASIKPGRKTIHLGTFDTAEEASAAYIGAAKVLWGEFARQ